MSLLKFDEIVKNDKNNLIIDIDIYFAHLSKDYTTKETLLEHSNLVLEYALKS